VSKAGDHTFRRTAAKSKYSKAIHDEFVNMFGHEERARNEGHGKKIWIVQKERRGKPDFRKRDKKKEGSTQMGNLETNDLLAKEMTNK
jgi:hypothetical protein